MAVSLQTLMAEVAQKYLGVELELSDGTLANLRNVLMLSEDERRAAVTLLASIDAGALDGTAADTDFDADAVEAQLQASREFAIAVSDRPTAVRAELETWPLVAVIELVAHYTEVTQAGEA